MDNKFETGYKLLAVTSRITTDNKVWNIQSPHGFQFQIHSENLDHILDNSDIVGRMIQKPCAFARRNNTNCLLLEDSNEHKALEYRRDVPKIRKPKVGHKYDTSMGEVVYLGKLTHWFIHYRGSLLSDDCKDAYGWHLEKNMSVRPEYYIDLGLQELSITDILDKKPYDPVFNEYNRSYTDPKVRLETVPYPTGIVLIDHYNSGNEVYCIRI